MDRRTTGAPVRYRQQPKADDAAVDCIACTGSSCRSCTAALIADCVAIGCCPCAVVNVLALTLVKLPWRASRRCLRLLRRRRRSLRKRVRDDGEVEKVGKMGMERSGVQDTMAAKACSGEGDVTGSSSGSRRSLCSTRLEGEKVWMEWYQRGHWGFGRVSISGNLEGHLEKRPSVSSPQPLLPTMC